MSASASVLWRAPAKINPFLAVLGKRPDGYHEVATTLLALDWCDELEVRVGGAAPAELELAGPAASDDIPRDARNLALRAAARAGASTGVQLKLYKHVPSQGGLGGGSSDAAAALLAIDALRGAFASAAERAAALAELGADVAFFGAAPSGYALCRGRGELVTPLAAPTRAWWIALLVPAIGSPTAAVYAALATSLRAPNAAPSVPVELLELDEPTARARLHNDLEPAALRAVPALARVRAVLDGCGAAHWRLSGSGSAFFGLHGDPARAAEELAALRDACAAAGIALRAARVCRPLGRGVHPVDAR
ncbi:MAG: 4-(cytidine 5'-diphospho)-2-C-methyl-D-erythritol kinase [Planctomycetota bacterium]|nr:MAG: 4-(cytidine 5'-diphospho)-2-C-methyl-D-erythritol kinase [Planctomycetota bacterium]